MSVLLQPVARSVLQLQWRQVTGNSSSRSSHSHSNNNNDTGKAASRNPFASPGGPSRAGQDEPSHNNLILLCFNFMKKFQVFSHTHTHQCSTHTNTHTFTHSHAVTPLNTRANALLSPHFPLSVFPSLSNVFFQLPHTDKVFNFAAETHLAQCESAPSLKCEI